MTKVDTSRKFVAPLFQKAGWDTDPHLNADVVQQHPDYACRVTANERDIGRGHMQRFQDVETRTPVFLTTSQLLTTGLDAPTYRNVVLVRLVNSMVELKQILGRGTRVRDYCATPTSGGTITTGRLPSLLAAGSLKQLHSLPQMVAPC